MMDCRTQPPSQRRIFHISTTGMQNVTEDGGVKKKITVHGSGHRVPRHATVAFHCTTYVQSSCTERVDSSTMRNTPFRCDIKDAGVPGLRIALRSMRVGEECQVRVTPEYGYGDVGCGNRIPPSAVLYFELTLLEYVETHDDGAMSSEECSKLPFSKLFKVCCLKYRDANRFLAAKNYVAADRGYADAAKLLESALEPPDDEQRNQRRGLLIKLYHKLAYCGLKIHDPKMAVASCRSVLRLDPADPRALYRCAVGLRELGEYEEAARMQRRAFVLKPRSEHVMNELVLLEDDDFVELARDKRVQRCLGSALEALDLSVTRRRLAIEQGVDPYTRRDIDKYLGLLATVGSPGREMLFTRNFSKDDLAYVRMTCDDLRLPYYPIPGGLRVRRPSV
ncbi:inactive peptidyl-prolyl cis-trans isomerase FKBP6 [Rhipicephalus sanguineus]|uniref:peptidylprolyl isomerase n=1 Tax=Rhipicephalus sanguineus TaxID=34632 RepID=A0A9D4SVN5_RHISA|nr:inactive peptidyl-prolyl cis-trans isomerase FKBP6 [Rhipicephalus sanguineus]KAH7951100.1 hypothetical protein HPB52_004731 [Rhipicephalus sanguineus]